MRKQNFGEIFRLIRGIYLSIVNFMVLHIIFFQILETENWKKVAKFPIFKILISWERLGIEQQSVQWIDKYPRLSDFCRQNFVCACAYPIFGTAHAHNSKTAERNKFLKPVFWRPISTLNIPSGLFLGQRTQTFSGYKRTVWLVSKNFLTHKKLD